MPLARRPGLPSTCLCQDTIPRLNSMSGKPDTRTAIITGAASGIGLETARALASEGWHLAIADIDRDQLDEVAIDLARTTEVLAVQVDVSNAAEVDAFAEAVFDRFGIVDFLHSNAGVALLSPLMTTRVDDWRWLLEVNVWGTINSFSAFVPRLVTQDRPSHITFTASIAGLVPAPRTRGLWRVEVRSRGHR